MTEFGDLPATWAPHVVAYQLICDSFHKMENIFGRNFHASDQDSIHTEIFTNVKPRDKLNAEISLGLDQ